MNVDRHRWPVLLAVVALATLGTGCLTIPPVRVTQTVGTTFGRVGTAHQTSMPEPAATQAWTTRFGFHPLQGFPSMFGRRFDIGAGYLFEALPYSGFDRLWRHGPYLQFDVTLWMAPSIWRDWYLRSSLGFHADVLFAHEQGSAIGMGGGTSISIHLIKFTTTSDQPADDDFMGVTSGEWGFGLTSGIDYRAIDGASYGVFSIGLVVHMPAAAGLVNLLPVAVATTSNVVRSVNRRGSYGGSSGGGASDVVQPGSARGGVRPSVEVRGR